LRERAIISSFQANALAQVKQAHPDVRTLLLVHRWPFPLRGKRSWGRIRRLQPWGVALPITLLTARRASFLKQFGAVGTWDQRFTRSEAKKASRIGLDLAIVHHVRTAAGLDVPASTP
jgi:glycerophosphoryl diester phosphodiesterase